jgi:hypothetical protein
VGFRGVGRRLGPIIHVRPKATLAISYAQFLSDRQWWGGNKHFFLSIEMGLPGRPLTNTKTMTCLDVA